MRTQRHLLLIRAITLPIGALVNRIFLTVLEILPAGLVQNPPIPIIMRRPVGPGVSERYQEMSAVPALGQEVTLGELAHLLPIRLYPAAPVVIRLHALRSFQSVAREEYHVLQRDILNVSALVLAEIQDHGGGLILFRLAL